MMLETNRDPGELEYRGVVIQRWDEMLSLTDMWRAASRDPHGAAEPENNRPRDWLRSADAKRFIEALSEVLGNSPHELHQVVRDNGDAETRAHWQIGLAYAKYLSPEFHMWCNTVVRDRMEGRIGPPADQMAATMELLRDPARVMTLFAEYAARQIASDAKIEQVSMQRDEASAKAENLDGAINRIASQEGSHNLTDGAKILKIRRKKLIADLQEWGWITHRGGTWKAYQTKTTAGLVTTIIYDVVMKDGSVEGKDQVRITNKGLTVIAKKLGLPSPVVSEPTSNVLDLRGGGRHHAG